MKHSFGKQWQANVIWNIFTYTFFLNFSLIIFLKEEKRDQKRGQDRQHKYKQKYWKIWKTAILKKIFKTRKNKYD